MNPEILIVHNVDGYRLLHGHLRLANLLNSAQNVLIDVLGEGLVTVAKTRDGVQVDSGNQRFKLHQS